MKSYHLIALVVVAVCAGLFATHRNSGADDSPQPQKTSGFSSRYVFASLTSVNGGYCLEDPEIRVLGGRSFIVGKADPTKHSRMQVSGHLMWIPVDTVGQMWEFNSVEEIKNSFSGEDGDETVAPQPPKSLKDQ